MPRFLKQTHLNAPADAVFFWHERPDALAELIPPWENVRVKSQTGPLSEEGSRVTLSLSILGPISMDWVSEHSDYVPGRQFQDIQISGPFHRWVHTHRVIPDGENSILEDEINYELPLSPISDWVAGWYVRNKLKRMFDYRHQQVINYFCSGNL